MVKIYISDTTKLSDEKTFQKYLSQMPKSRQQKIEKLRFSADKELSLLAGILLNYALSDNGIVLKDDDIIKGENGKPHLKNSELFFNLSHSGKIAMCAVSDKDIGCDVERIKDIDLKIAKRFFSDEEYAYILSLSDYEKQKDSFFRLWTLKESFMKITGHGLKLPLDEFSIDISKETVTVYQKLNINDYRFRELNLDNAYKFSVCYLGDSDIKTEKVNI